MGLRFTETNKWKDDWYLSLSNDYKIIWQYLVDNCSISGLWQKGFTAMNFFCKTNITEPEFYEVFKGRCFDVEKTNFIFIPKFLKVQYPKGLSSEKPLIVSVRKEIEKFNLYLIIKQSLPNDYTIIKVKDTGKGKGKRKTEEGKKKEENKHFPPTLIFPYTSNEFLNVWDVLSKMKKWKGKSFEALQASLKKLSEHPEETAIKMMEKAIAGEYQGIFELNENKNGIHKQPLTGNDLKQAIRDDLKRNKY